MHGELTKVGYHRAYSDNAVYVHLSTNDDVTILAIHVDNVLSFGNTEAGLKLAQSQLHEIFAMKEEDPSWVMGFQLIDNQTQRTISINHRQYIDAILRCFNMHECEPIDTPLDHAIVLSEKDCPATDKERAKMQNVVPKNSTVTLVPIVCRIFLPDFVALPIWISTFTTVECSIQVLYLNFA